MTKTFRFFEKKKKTIFPCIRCDFVLTFHYIVVPTPGSPGPGDETRRKRKGERKKTKKNETLSSRRNIKHNINVIVYVYDGVYFRVRRTLAFCRAGIAARVAMFYARVRARRLYRIYCYYLPRTPSPGERERERSPTR